jgi:hypothetical protein
VAVVSDKAVSAEPVSAKVSFPFIVSNVGMPAGDYLVKPVSDGSSVLEVENADNGSATLINANAASPSIGQPIGRTSAEV